MRDSYCSGCEYRRRKSDAVIKRGVQIGWGKPYTVCNCLPYWGKPIENIGSCPKKNIEDAGTLKSVCRVNENSALPR